VHPSPQVKASAAVLGEVKADLAIAKAGLESMVAKEAAATAQKLGPGGRLTELTEATPCGAASTKCDAVCSRAHYQHRCICLW
jgi:hypothetical protein